MKHSCKIKILLSDRKTHLIERCPPLEIICQPCYFIRLSDNIAFPHLHSGKTYEIRDIFRAKKSGNLLFVIIKNDLHREQIIDIDLLKDFFTFVNSKDTPIPQPSIFSSNKK
jgi:hypothetical protein